MNLLRWTCLACYLFGLVGCNSGSTDPAKNPVAAAAVKERADKIEALKAKSARKPGR